MLGSGFECGACIWIQKGDRESWVLGSGFECGACIWIQMGDSDLGWCMHLDSEGR